MVILLWLTLFDIAGSFRTSVEKVDCSKREHDFDQIHKVKGYYGFDMDPGWIVAIDSFFPKHSTLRGSYGKCFSPGFIQGSRSGLRILSVPHTKVPTSGMSMCMLTVFARET